MKPFILLFAVGLIMASCLPGKDSSANLTEQPFDFAHSDPAAVELADSIMMAMGGRENWDKTHYISWDFEGVRKWVWDKKKGRARIEIPDANAIYLIDLNSLSGRVQVKGREITHPDSLKEDLALAKLLYFNDLNSLAMPFRLKEAGVRLKYMGEDTLKGNRYNVLQLTFQKSSDTPDMNYKVYVDVKEKLVRHCAYLRDTLPTSAYYPRPWDNYQKFGNIMLSSNRSDNAGPKNVKVEESVPDKVFTEF